MTARERMLAGAGMRERWLDIAGIRSSVMDAGDGSPLILLHGGIECGGIYWAPVAGALARSHRVVAPDVPGLGESDPAPRLDDASFARWLDALIDLTCAEPPVVVAHSLVGTLAARFAVERGDRLRGLAVYAAPGIGPYRLPLGLRIVAMRFSLRPTERNEERFERYALLDLDRLRARDGDWFEAFAAYQVAKARERHVKRTMTQLLKLGTARVPDAALRRIGCPVTLIWGRADRMVPLDLALGAHARLGWPLEVIDDAAHVPHLEAPEAFAARVGALHLAARP